jgi:hypothetical protein
MLRKGRVRMAVDNSCTRITGEESEHPPLTSCSQIVLFEEQKKRTTHLLRNRTILFVDNTEIRNQGLINGFIDRWPSWND